MNCKKMERWIYFNVDGLLEGPEKRLFKDHLDSCDRCRRLYDDAKKSLSILKRPLSESNMIPRDEIDAIVTMEFEKIHASGKKRFVFPVQKKWAIAALVVLALGAGYWFRTAISNRPGTPGTSIPMARNSLKERVITTEDRTDSLLVLGPSCRMRLQKNSRALIRRNGPKVVKVELISGRIICAAQKGIYDTIMVGCAGVRVFAVGTHFSVEKQEQGVLVSVLEGTIKAWPLKTDSAIIINSQEKCFISFEGKCSLSLLADETQRLMAEEFATMSPQHAGKTRKPLGGKDVSHDSLEALCHYAIVESMMKKGKFDNAVYVILDYLATYRLKHDQAYVDLGLCYLKTARPEKTVRVYSVLMHESSDPDIVETAMHKVNTIQFTMLNDYEEAHRGITEYLAKYPSGRWRESELYYLIKIYLYYQKDLQAARPLAKQYCALFPATCRAREIASDMAKINRDASR
jgi:FecR protein.